MERNEHEVAIAGGGPTGLMLAGELALAGVDVAVVERRTSQHVDGSRAGGLHARTLEVLDQRGIADRFLSAGRVEQIQGFAGIPLDISDFPSRHPYGLALWQRDFEPILAGWVEELGVPVLRGRDVLGFDQDDVGVDVHLSDGAPLRASFLVGCDGGRSRVRKVAGIDFPGHEPSMSWMLAEVDMREAPLIGMRPEGGGIGPVDRTTGAGPYRVVLVERRTEHRDSPTLGALRDRLRETYGTDFGAHSPSWITRFTDTARQAVSYRNRRVLVAGDAAHIHPPHGGQGLNTGVQDAVNLGWKLAQVVHGTSPDSLLDTYTAERHPVAARVLHNTLAQVALSTPGPRHDGLRDIVAELLGMEEPRRRIAAMVSGLDIRYDVSDSHPLVGRRMPDLDLHTADGVTRVAELLRAARPLLLDFAAAPTFDIAPWAKRVRLVRATHRGEWALPLVGAITPTPAVLVRPDGHVAWAGDPSDPALAAALTRWFGNASSDAAQPAATPTVDHEPPQPAKQSPDR